MIGLPDEAELTRLVHVTRISHGLRIADWPALPSLARAMAAELQRARQWQSWLRSMADQGQPLDLDSLRKTGRITRSGVQLDERLGAA